MCFISHISLALSPPLFFFLTSFFVCSSGLISYHPCGMEGSGRSRSELVANLVILMVGCAPAAASAVYKQSYLAQHVRNI